MTSGVKTRVVSAKKKATKLKREVLKKKTVKRGASARVKKPAVKKKTASTSEDKSSWEPNSVWLLRLYVAGNTEKSSAAIANLKRVCETHLQKRYKIEVVDLLRNPKLAGGDQILAIPTLVRRLPGPVKRIIGDLSDTERVIVGLDLRPYPIGPGS